MLYTVIRKQVMCVKKGKSKRKRKSNGSFRCLVFTLILFCLWIFSTFTITVNEVEISDKKIEL